MRLRLREIVQVDYLLFNLEQPLFHSRHAFLFNFHAHLSSWCLFSKSLAAESVLNRLKLKTVESLGIKLCEVLEFALASQRYGGLIQLPNK